MKTSIYINFKTETEEAFNYYKSIFGGDFIGPIMRIKDVPKQEGMQSVPESDMNLIMYIALELPGGILLRGTDMPESMGMPLNVGNNYNIMISLDTKEQADEYFNKLSKGGNITMPMKDQFWGDYFGSCIDKYGINWMIAKENN